MKISEEKYKIIRCEVIVLVKKACYSEKNFFTDTVWSYHIIPVVEHSLKLGEKLNADLKILELSAYLHDYAAILSKDLYDEHHEHGAILAEEILKKYDIEKEDIEHIKSCIFAHRGSKNKEKESIEASILASADAMSHISELADMMYLAYGVHSYKTEEGAIWLKKKLKRSWDKIMPEGRQLVKNDYKIAINTLDKAIK